MRKLLITIILFIIVTLTYAVAEADLNILFAKDYLSISEEIALRKNNIAYLFALISAGFFINNIINVLVKKKNESTGQIIDIVV